MSPPYVLVFRGRREPKGWTGSWPPPKRMWIATGRTTGYVAFIDPDTLQPAEVMDQLDDLAVVERYERLSYSELPYSPDVIRGAEYILEDDHRSWPDLIAAEAELQELTS